MKHGVYVVSNVMMPGIVKIGFTNGSMNSRLKGLNNTSVPTPFVIEKFWPCDNPQLIEDKLHKHFTNKNVGKEFFSVTPKEVEKVVKTFGKLFTGVDNQKVVDALIKEYTENSVYIDEHKNPLLSALNAEYKEIEKAKDNISLMKHWELVETKWGGFVKTKKYVETMWFGTTQQWGLPASKEADWNELKAKRTALEQELKKLSKLIDEVKVSSCKKQKEAEAKLKELGWKYDWKQKVWKAV